MGAGNEIKGMMMNEDIAKQFAQEALDEQLKKLAGTERMADVTQEIKDDYLSRQVDMALKSMAGWSTDDGAYEAIIRCSFHPSNKRTRAMFEQWAGVSLPKSVAGTESVVLGVFGAERMDRVGQVRKLIKQKAADEKEAKEEVAKAKRIDSIRESLKSGGQVSGRELLDLARSMGVEVHLRTAGTLLKRISRIGKGEARVSGKGGVPDGVWSVLDGVLRVVSDDESSDLPEITDVQAKHLFGVA
jgi:hypothetical protein